MIVKMKHLDLVCVAQDTEKTLEALRSLGAVHLDLASAKGAETQARKNDAAMAERAVRAIFKARKSLEYGESLQKLPCDTQGVLALEARLDDRLAQTDALEKEIRKYEAYGDFDPDLARSLKENGVNLVLKDDGTYSISYGEDAASAGEIELPRESLSTMRAELDAAQNDALSIRSKLAASDEASILSQYPELADRIAFAAAKELIEKAGEVAVISGWIPVPKIAALKENTAKNGWGVLLRDAAADETPPTLIEPPKLFRPVKALFDGLGIAPAYTEADVSVPFMCYFSLFFAMLVGDGAYGLIFLAATLFGWRKYRASASRSPVAKSWLVLLTVFSLATVAWGVLSNTWFGANIPACAEWPSVKWLADPSYKNMMLLCFTIGASHLVLARLWNAVCKLPDTTAIAELGWAGVLVMMYLVTNAIVGIFPGVPQWGIWMGGISVAFVFLFSVKPSELKTRGAELGMLPLNIMSALGDIISYVRLFAVGLASVKVAENFNQMAVGMDLPLWLKIVPMVAILVVGHGLNLAMAALSILVHAVRLNTLEFSNHKGVSWAGYSYRPFARTARI